MVRSPPTLAITDVSPVLKKVLHERKEIFDSTELTAAPVAQFYDLDLWDAHLEHCAAAFGETVHHFIAIKSNSITRMLKYALDTHGFGVECASIGEVLHAMNHCRIPCDKIVFDSPCKTVSELQFAIQHKIHCNLDNFDEYERAVAIVAANGGLETGGIGMRINPLVGAGTIAALSVSTSDSKFGVAISEKDRLLKAYLDSPWLNSVHVHVGSGGMGAHVLTAGIQVAVAFAKEVNSQTGRRQVLTLDIGGGLPVNYWGDDFGAEKVPTFTEYAKHLREHVPELFSGEFKVLTEFGQSMNAKCGFLASRIEWMKGTPERPIAIIHFGADCCPRQAYTPDHPRRFEAYQEDGAAYPVQSEDTCVATGVGGPLCFQGDFLAKGVALPRALHAGDILVMKDAGANTLSLFSRHCSRLCPPVYGYRWTDDSQSEVSEIQELKPRETMQELSDFWGPL
jgi:diaminopimelate decarboxylase